jgi:hypothetical protein
LRVPEWIEVDHWLHTTKESKDSSYERTPAMKTFYSLLAGGALLLANTAFAAQPLSETQMDRVTAGATALANGGALALGELTTVTFSRSGTDINTATFPRYAVGLNVSQALAAGGFLFQAAAAAHSDTAASLP